MDGILWGASYCFSLTVASEDDHESSGWRPEDLLAAAAVYTSQQMPKTCVRAGFVGVCYIHLMLLWFQ